MKKVLLCFLASMALVACNKPEAEERTPSTPSTPSAPTPARVAKNGTPSPTPQAGDWMWKKKGTPRYTDPLKVKEGALDQKPKK